MVEQSVEYVCRVCGKPTDVAPDPPSIVDCTQSDKAGLNDLTTVRGEILFADRCRCGKRIVGRKVNEVVEKMYFGDQIPYTFGGFGKLEIGLPAKLNSENSEIEDEKRLKPAKINWNNSINGLWTLPSIPLETPTIDEIMETVTEARKIKEEHDKLQRAIQRYFRDQETNGWAATVLNSLLVITTDSDDVRPALVADEVMPSIVVCNQTT